MTTYTTYSEAGGVGKTTLAANLGAADVRDGRSVLAIDLDPQDASLTHLLGADADRAHDGDSIVHHLIGQASGDLEDLVVETTSGIDLIPSHNLLTRLEEMLRRAKQNAEALGQTFASKDRLRQVIGESGLHEEYDTIIVDPPATPGTHLYNAISATHNLVVPVEPTGKGEASVDGLEDLVDGLETELEDARDVDDVEVGVLAVVPNRVGQTNDQQVYLEELRDRGYDAPEALGERRSLFEGCWSEQCSAFEYVEDHRKRERDHELDTLAKLERLAAHVRGEEAPGVSA